VAELQKKNNSFDASNHIRCFNHTIQLSCKALLKPFTSPITPSATDGDNVPDLEGAEEDGKDDSADEGEELACDTEDDMDDDIDELDALSGEEQATFLEATVAVREAVTKVRILPFTHALLPYMMPSGSKAVVCSHPLDYNHIASMASYLQGQPPQA
jgi:hypothetical protein